MGRKLVGHEYTGAGKGPASEECEELMKTWDHDIDWLTDVLKTLQTIKQLATQIEAEEDSGNALLRIKILEHIALVLVQYVPSSVDLDSLSETP